MDGSEVPDDNLAFIPLGAETVTLTAGDEPVIAIFIGGEPLGSALSGPEMDSMIGTQYSDGRAFPQYGAFPPDQPDPLPAPELPNARLKLRG